MGLKAMLWNLFGASFSTGVMLPLAGKAWPRFSQLLFAMGPKESGGLHHTFIPFSPLGSNATCMGPRYSIVGMSHLGIRERVTLPANILVHNPPLEERHLSTGVCALPC